MTAATEDLEKLGLEELNRKLSAAYQLLVNQTVEIHIGKATVGTPERLESTKLYALKLLKQIEPLLPEGESIANHAQALLDAAIKKENVAPKHLALFKVVLPEKRPVPHPEPKTQPKTQPKAPESEQVAEGCIKKTFREHPAKGWGAVAAGAAAAIGIGYWAFKEDKKAEQPLSKEPQRQ